MMDVKDANDDLEQPQQKLMSSSSPKSLSTSLTALSVASRTRSEGSISGGSESNRDSIDSSFPFSESFSPPSDSFLNTLDLGVSFGGDSPPINSPSASLRSSRSSSVGDGACGTLHPTIVTPLDQNRKLYSSPPKLSNTCKINPSVSYSKTQSSTVSHNFAPYSVPVYSKLPTGHYQRHPQVTPYGPYSFPPGYQRVGTRQMDSSGRMISNIEQRFPRPPIAYRQNHQMSSVGGRVVHPSMIGSRGHGPSSANVMGSYSGGPAHFSRRPVNDSRPYSYVSSRSYERLDEFLKPRPQHSRDFVPKFYKSVIDDVVNNIREIFLDDGVDEQVIQDLRTIWERKITDTRAIEHATNNNSNTNSNNTSNSKSKSNHAKQAAAAATAAVNQSQSAAGAHTSVITSNPNHMKNGPSSNTNNNNSTVRVKDEIIEEEQQQHHSQQQHQATARRPVAVTTQPQLTTMVQPASPMVTTNGNLIHHPNLAQQVAPSTNILRASAIVSNPSGPASLPAGLTAAPNSGHLIQEPMKFQTIIGGQKVMILPNNAGGQYVMTAPSTQFVLTPEILNQINLSGGILTTGPNGQPTVLHRAPASALGASTIQYATAPGIQQVRTVAAPGLMQQLTAAQPQLGQPGAANATNTRVAQLDGLGDSSSEDEDEDDYRDNDDDQDDNDDEMNDEENDGGIEDEEPLNSGDDVSEEDPNELFDTDNVVVCQYDKITRSRNKWKFHFKDGIMNLQGKDYVFQKAVGDAEW